MTIVAASDEGYAPHFAALLHSLATHCPDETVWFLDCGVEDQTRELLLRFAQRLGVDLQWLRVDPDALSGFPLSGHWTPATHARILIPELLPDVRRVLYLDVDCIVTGDLRPLLEIDLGAFLLAAVADPAREAEPFEAPDYINTGVMLINLDAWRSEGISLKAAEYLVKHSPKFVDQSAINAVTIGRKMVIDNEWNLLVAYADRDDWRLHLPAAVPRIVHFCGGMKPWRHKDAPLGAIYRVHRRATPFPVPKLHWVRYPLKLAIGLAISRPKYVTRWQFDRHFQRTLVAPYLDQLKATTNSNAGPAKI